MSIFKDIWKKTRPYLVILISDALITIFMWLMLWTFKFITGYLNIETWVSEWINNIHSVGFILLYVTFGFLLINDIIRLFKENGSND